MTAVPARVHASVAVSPVVRGRWKAHTCRAMFMKTGHKNLLGALVTSSTTHTGLTKMSGIGLTSCLQHTRLHSQYQYLTCSWTWFYRLLWRITSDINMHNACVYKNGYVGVYESMSVCVCIQVHDECLCMSA